MKRKSSKYRQAIFCLLHFLFKTIRDKEAFYQCYVENAFRKVQVNPQRLKLNEYIGLWSVLIMNIHWV